MIWGWWGAMVVLGLILGSFGAWTRQAARVFMKTLAIPLGLVIAHVATPGLYPFKNQPHYLFIDILLIATAALIADYLVGRKLGRHDRAGFREDSVGH